MTAGGGNKLPYGNLPRLILAWISTEAVRTQSRVLVLGASLSEFMRTLGMEDRSGSPRGDRTELWWNPKRPDEPSLWDSKIHLGEAFFNEIINHPVPLDTNILTALKRSPLGLDLYLWLAYRTFSLKRPLRLSWRQVYHQFGAHLLDQLSRFSAKVA